MDTVNTYTSFMKIKMQEEKDRKNKPERDKF